MSIPVYHETSLVVLNHLLYYHTVYINSFLASLNTRKRLRRRLTGYTSTHPASSAPIPLGLCRPRIRESRGDVGGEDATVVSPHRVQADVFTIPKYDGAEDYKVSFLIES